jgi:hypothetical protein
MVAHAVMPAPNRLRQKDGEFKASQGTQQLCSQTMLQRQKQNNKFT